MALQLSVFLPPYLPLAVFIIHLVACNVSEYINITNTRVTPTSGAGKARLTYLVTLIIFLHF